jgi:branched-chain amino acid transport system substrate-binding protein
MKPNHGILFGLISILLSHTAPMAHAAEMTDGVIKIGVMNDQSGSLADQTGRGSVAAAELAVEEFGGAIDGVKIELVSADHQNKPDVGSAIARRWMTVEKVDAIADLSHSGVALAVVTLATERKKIVLNNSGSADFTGKACSPVAFQWNFSTYTNAVGLVKALMKDGKDTWFLVTVDYAFGHQLSADTRKAVEANGGKILGEVRHPMNNMDFSSALLRAQSSGAKVIAFANSGNDVANAAKQAAEFGINKTQTLATPTVWLSDVDAMGLNVGQGLQFAEPFYWDQSEESRKWSEKFYAKTGRMPTSQQAATYSSVKHYLKAVKALKTDDTDKVLAKMRATPVEDAVFPHGKIREDGAMLHDFSFVRVKTPAESKKRWDYYHVLRTLKAEDIYPKLETQGCSLIK